MEKNQDEGVKNLTRSGVRSKIDAILSRAGTFTIIKQAVRDEIETFENSLRENPEVKKEIK
jgi:hypothetical protein